MKRKIIVMLAMTLLSAILFVSLTKVQAAPEEFYVYAWVDKLQYAPGDSGTLYVTIRNDMASEVYAYNITVVYPWNAYVEDHWEGNDTVDVKTAIERDGGVVNKEFTFEVPKDGKAVVSSGVDVIDVYVYTDELGMEYPDNSVLISVANPPVHMAITDMDMWMTSLTVAIVICTIILAIVVFLSTRKARHPRVVAPPPPPKPKAKTA